MKDFTKKAMAVGIIGLAGLGAVGAVSAFGSHGTLTGSKGDMHGSGAFGNDLVDHEAVEQAFDDGDYEAYLEAVSDSPRGQMSEDQFNQMADMHQLHIDAQTAIENEDYESWLAAVSQIDENAGEIITADEFDDLVEIHNSMEHARELADEIGLQELDMRARGPSMEKEGSKQGMMRHRMRPGFRPRTDEDSN